MEWIPLKKPSRLSSAENLAHTHFGNIPNEPRPSRSRRKKSLFFSCCVRLLATVDIMITRLETRNQSWSKQPDIAFINEISKQRQVDGAYWCWKTLLKLYSFFTKQKQHLWSGVTTKPRRVSENECGDTISHYILPRLSSRRILSLLFRFRLTIIPWHVPSLATLVNVNTSIWDLESCAIWCWIVHASSNHVGPLYTSNNDVGVCSIKCYCP